MQAYAAQRTSSEFGFCVQSLARQHRATGSLPTPSSRRARRAKAASSPISGVLDYPEYVTARGFNLQCTPGNDVESVTAQVGAGSNLVLFTTGLGTPTGNPIAPVVKISTNSTLAERMSDIIDFDAGGIVSGEATIRESAEKLMELSHRSGERRAAYQSRTATAKAISFRGSAGSRCNTE